MTEASEPPGGTYTLLVELPTSATIEVGALGVHEFAPGWYGYTGSALGSGGFSRVERHRELAAGERDTHHWHVDYLLGHPATSVDAVICSHGADIECSVAMALDGEPVPDFGCSDCPCLSHLHYSTERAGLLDSACHVHERAAGDEPERRLQP